VTSKELREHLARLGKKGGEASGKSKVRGDADYFSRIGKKAAKARKAKRQSNQ
jgi:general stress protein YciG